MEGRRRFNYSRANFEEIAREFSECDWSTLFGKSDVNTCYKLFMNIYENACEKYVPLTKYRPMKRDKWMTTEIADFFFFFS